MILQKNILYTLQLCHLFSDDLSKKISKAQPSSNARKSPWRVKMGKVAVQKRGGDRYYLYIQERFSDIYCYITKSRLFPTVIKDNFTQEDLVKVDKKLLEIKRYLFYLELEKKKKISFSLNSIKLK